MRVSSAGGVPEMVATSPSGLYRASWDDHGNIVFSDEGFRFLPVRATGGSPDMIMRTDTVKTGGVVAIAPHVLPGNEHLLFTSGRLFTGTDSSDVLALDIKTGTTRRVLADAAVVSGQPVGVVDGVMQTINMPNSRCNYALGQFALSAAGQLVYVAGGVFTVPPSAIQRVSKSGTTVPLGSKRQASSSSAHHRRVIALPSKRGSHRAPRSGASSCGMSREGSRCS